MRGREPEKREVSFSFHKSSFESDAALGAVAQRASRKKVGRRVGRTRGPGGFYVHSNGGIIMSERLLRALNGNRNGRFRAWLDRLGREPRIAWYPSAGTDFRALLHLSPSFAAMEPAFGPEPAPPDIFLFTDYFPWGNMTFLDSPTLYEDEHTTVTVRHLEPLPRLDLPLDPEIVDFPEGSVATGHVLFMELEVRSDRLGTLTWPLVYAFCENEAFCARTVLPNGGRFSHVILVRYGNGLGGGKCSGAWIRNVLERVGCEAYIASGPMGDGKGDEAVPRLYPELAAVGPRLRRQQYRVTPSARWSSCGNVYWFRMLPAATPGKHRERTPVPPEVVELQFDRLSHALTCMTFIARRFPEAAARIPERLLPFPGGYTLIDGECSHPEAVRRSWLAAADDFEVDPVPEGFFLAGLQNMGTSEYLLLMWRQGERRFWFKARYVAFHEGGDLMEAAREALHTALADWDAGGGMTGTQGWEA